MKKLLKRISICLLISFMLVTFVSQLTLAEEEVTINFIGPDWVDDALGEAIEIFEEEHPNINVEPQDLPFRSLFEAIEVKLSSDSKKPDIVAVDVPLVASYGIRDYLLPLNDYFSEEDLNILLDEAKEAAYYKEKLLAPPLRTSTQILYYNKDLFSEAGLEPPPEDPENRWTWEETLEAAKKLTADTNDDGSTDIWGLLFHQINRPYQILALPQSAGGGSGVSEDGTTVINHLTNEGWIKAMNFYHDLFNKWEVSPTGIDSDSTQEQFAAGKAGMIIGGTWGVGMWKEHPSLNWGASYHPYFADGEPATPTGSWHWGVNKHTEHPEEAAEFLKFLSTDPRVAKSMFVNTARVAAQKTIFEFTNEELNKAEIPENVYEIMKYELNNTATPRPKMVGYLEWEDLLTQALEDIRNGADPETRLQRAERRIQPLLDKYRR